MTLCKKEHEKHNIQLYDKITQHKMKKNNELKSEIDINIKSLKTKSKMIIDRLNNVMKIIEKYFKILENINDNFNISNTNNNISENFKYRKK